MITSRHIQKVIWAAVLPAVLVLGILAAFSNQLSSGISLSYEQKLFDTDQVMTVNIRIDEDEWDDLLETAISETYYCCDIEINGETYYRVGIRAKGNTSLSMVASSDSDRYSFKVKFDEYVDGQTCYGLDKLVLNNNYSDATMMKEAVVYDMFAFLDVDASLYNYARISVNGEYWGVYLALEAVEESFALRNYGTHYGNLYKPDSMEMGGAGRMKDVDLDQIEDWTALILPHRRMPLPNKRMAGLTVLPRRSKKKPEIRTAEPHGKAVRILEAGREDLVRAARRRFIISTTIWTAIR